MTVIIGYLAVGLLAGVFAVARALHGARVMLRLASAASREVRSEAILLIKSGRTLLTEARNWTALLRTTAGPTVPLPASSPKSMALRESKPAEEAGNVPKCTHPE